MNTKQLHVTPCFNPYFIGSNQVEKIHFFNDAGIVATMNRAWIGSNNYGNTALESIEYRCKRKPVFGVDYSYYIGSDLYVNTAQLPGFRDLGEKIALKTDSETCYGHYIGFEYGESRANHEQLQEVKFREFMLATYTRCVPTEFGATAIKISDALNDAGIDVSRYSIERLATKNPNLFKAMSEAIV